MNDQKKPLTAAQKNHIAKRIRQVADAQGSLIASAMFKNDDKKHLKLLKLSVDGARKVVAGAIVISSYYGSEHEIDTPTGTQQMLKDLCTPESWDACYRAVNADMKAFTQARDKALADLETAASRAVDEVILGGGLNDLEAQIADLKAIGAAFLKLVK